jgi:hypothetical protein
MNEPGFPEPLVRHRIPRHGEVPVAAERMKRVALEHGWETRMRYAKGYYMTNDGTPAKVTVRAPLIDEETGQVARSATGRERFTVTETVELRVVESLLLQCRKGDRIVAVTWLDGSFNGPARTLDGKFLTATQMRDYLKEEVK